MNRVISRWFVLVLILFLHHSLHVYGQGDPQGVWEPDKLEKLLSGNSFEVILAALSKNSAVRWSKVYSAEFCAQHLKGKEQAEALQTRRSAEMLFTQLKSYQRTLKEMPLEEFAKAVNQLLDLRDCLSQRGYGNMVLQLCIERIVALRIAERVVLRDDDLRVLEGLMQRNNQWKHEWRTVCEMIEEEDGKKLFDYALMEKMKKSEIYTPGLYKEEDDTPRGTVLYDFHDLEQLFYPEHREEGTILGILRKRSFNGLLQVLFVEEYNDRTILPGLILFKQRGGGFEGKWKDQFKRLMADYMERTDLCMHYIDVMDFEGVVEGVKDLDAEGGRAFMFDRAGTDKGGRQKR